MTERRLAVVADYDALVAALRARAEELDISRETTDAVSGLQPGYSGKLLSSQPIRAFGRVSLGPILQSLCVKLVVVEDQEMLAKLAPRLVPRKRKSPPRPAG
jgi:hypothetical protein